MPWRSAKEIMAHVSDRFLCFGALPAGNYNGSYNNFGNNANFWSATEGSSNSYGYSRKLYYNNADVVRETNYRNKGLSVRCVRDE